ncbi:hypothetical protein F5Y17DRAFT_426717 [Xylariaceae sp. FL0594]|nr:hypothetical protein F5Y17DRAFT_426717 [Xylariaceae sp. FL0594]
MAPSLLQCMCALVINVLCRYVVGPPSSTPDSIQTYSTISKYSLSSTPTQTPSSSSLPSQSSLSNHLGSCTYCRIPATFGQSFVRRALLPSYLYLTYVSFFSFSHVLYQTGPFPPSAMPLPGMCFIR